MRSAATGPHFDFRFDDSELSGIDAAGGDLVLRFAAAHVERVDLLAPEPRQPGYAKQLRIVLGGASWSGPEQDCIGRIAQGSLILDGVHCKTIALPLEHGGAVRLELDFNNRSRLAVTARSISIGFSGDPAFAESYAC